MKLQRFKTQSLLKPLICEVCRQDTTDLNKVTISTINYGHRYKTSGRPWVDRYRVNCCQTCYNKIEIQLNKIKIGEEPN